MTLTKERNETYDYISLNKILALLIEIQKTGKADVCYSFRGRSGNISFAIHSPKWTADNACLVYEDDVWLNGVMSNEDRTREVIQKLNILNARFSLQR